MTEGYTIKDVRDWWQQYQTACGYYGVRFDESFLARFASILRYVRVHHGIVGDIPDETFLEDETAVELFEGVREYPKVRMVMRRTFTTDVPEGGAKVIPLFG